MKSAARASAAFARDPSIDALRGFALIGILFINIDLFAFPGTLTMLAREEFTGVPDRLAQSVIVVFAAGKFLPIFCFVFGWSAYHQIHFDERGPDRFRRRLGAFAAIGALHFALIYPGDIVSSYALVGLFLLRSCRWDARRLARNVVVWLAATMTAYLLLGVLPINLGDLNESPEELARQRMIYATGSWSMVMAEHIRIAREFAWMPIAQAVIALPFARLGYLIARRADELAAIRGSGAVAVLEGMLARWVLGSLAAGLVINGTCGAIVLVADNAGLRNVAVTVAFAVGGALFAVVYVRLAIAFLSDPRCLGWRAKFAVVGRMSLSVFVAQSLVAGLVFYGYGFGFHGSLGPAGVAGAAILVNVIVFASALAWHHAFGQGPLERVVAVVGGHRLHSSGTKQT